MPPVIEKEKCNGCGWCLDICPTDVFGPSNSGDDVPTVRYPEECWHCNACVLDCRPLAVVLRIPLHAMMLYVSAEQEGAF